MAADKPENKTKSNLAHTLSQVNTQCMCYCVCANSSLHISLSIYLYKIAASLLRAAECSPAQRNLTKGLDIAFIHH